LRITFKALYENAWFPYQTELFVSICNNAIAEGTFSIDNQQLATAHECHVDVFHCRVTAQNKELYEEQYGYIRDRVQHKIDSHTIHRHPACPNNSRAGSFEVEKVSSRVAYYSRVSCVDYDGNAVGTFAIPEEHRVCADAFDQQSNRYSCRADDQPYPCTGGPYPPGHILTENSIHRCEGKNISPVQ